MATTTMTAMMEAMIDPGDSPPPQRGVHGLATRWQSARRGLRGRILVPFVLILGIATLASVFVQHAVLRQQVNARIDADLRQEVTELRQLIGGRDPQGGCIAGRDPQGGCVVGRDPETGEPFGADLRAVFDTFLRRNIPSEFETLITFVDGRPYKVPAVRSSLAADVDSALYQLASVRSPQQGDLPTDAGRVRYLAVPVQTAQGGTQGVFVVAQFSDAQRAQMEATLGVMTAAELALLVIASALAFALAGRLLSPVRTVTETARQISETDLSRRIESKGDDEVALLARTFNQMLDRLQTAFVAQRNFIDDAGHELRTPITIIRGHLELLGDDPVERREAIEIVTDELDRMSRMVDDLLLLARAERPDFLSIDLVDVEEVTSDLFAKASTLGPRAWELEATGRGKLVADRQRVTQAVMQLAQNATEHTSDGQRISIGSQVADGQARFWVHDSGPGVAASDVERIFERFSRGSRTRRTDGSGLGLSIVKAIAEAHGGTVTVTSPPPAGAIFELSLPVDGPPMAQGQHE
jgi:signal transduction histidine kinase